jgi:hypothetical protein
MVMEDLLKEGGELRGDLTLQGVGESVPDAPG